MGIKLLIKGTNTPIDLQRVSTVPREGDTVILTLKGEKKEKLYTVWLVEHTFDLNMAVNFGNTVITLEEVKPLKKQKSG
jgi:hypothetical protein